MYFPDLETYITEMSLSCPYITIDVSEWGASVTYPEELLSSGDDVSNNESGAKRQDDVLVIGMENKSINYFAYNLR